HRAGRPGGAREDPRPFPRARLLALLDEPAATGDLALRAGLSAGGTSQHLTALRDAGLVSAHRTGRYVLYARTEIAEALLNGRS
ncbi:helix-turn-helix domain-containing protein, partial [Spirillospora sp. NPDC049652]